MPASFPRKSADPIRSGKIQTETLPDPAPAGHECLYLVLSEQAMEGDALYAIAEAQAADTLFVSPITAWEAALALQKSNHAKRPDLRGQDAATWFRRGRRSTGARLVPIGPRVALEAARVPAACGQRDSGDCYIIATARVSKLTIVTRDQRIAGLTGLCRTMCVSCNADPPQRAQQTADREIDPPFSFDACADYCGSANTYMPLLPDVVSASGVRPTWRLAIVPPPAAMATYWRPRTE